MKQANDLILITKAQALATYTIKLTSNSNKFPKKYRFSVCNKMQLLSMDIYELIFDANATPASDKSERYSLQTKAIGCCTKLLFYISMCIELNIISTESAEYWSKLVSDIKFITISWRTKDKNR